MAISFPNVVKAVGAGVNSVTTSGVTTTTGSTFVIKCSAGAGVTFSTPTDSKGNTYTLIDNQVAGSVQVSSWYCSNGAGGASHTAACAFTGGATDYPVMHFVELAGAATASFDSGSVASQTDADPGPYNLTSGTLAQADSAIVAWAASEAGGSQNYAASGYTVASETDGNNYWTSAVAYKTVATTSAQSITWTGVSGNMALGIAAFKAAAGGTAYTLVADPAAYSLTAAAETLQVARAVTVAPASYAVSAQPVNLAVGRTLNVSPASYTLNAADVTLTYAAAAKELLVDPASFSVSARPVTAIATRALSIDQASYGLVNSAVTLSVGRAVSFNAASYSLTASSLTLVVSRALSVDPAAYVLTAPDVALEYRSANPVLSVDPVSYVLGAAEVELTKSTVGGIDTWGSVYIRKKKLDANETVAGPLPGPSLRETIESVVAATERKAPKPAQKVKAFDFEQDEEEALMLLL